MAFQERQPMAAGELNGWCPRATPAAVHLTGEVINFTPKKRPRGRPKKPLMVSQRCTDGFEVVAAAVVGIARSKGCWSAAKERARAAVDKDPHLSPYSWKVFGFLLEHINRAKGFDWHGVEALATNRGMNPRTVQKAFEQLSERGHILRRYEIITGSKASKVWHTTLPTLVRAGIEVQKQRAAKDTPRKADGYAQKICEGDAQLGTQTLKEEHMEENTGRTADAGASVPAVKLKKAFREEGRKATGARQSLGDTLASLGLLPEPLPRFDKSKLLSERVTTWRYRKPDCPEELRLYDRMLRATKGRDREKLKEVFVDYYKSERTHDAQLEFVKWLERRGQERGWKPMPGYSG